MKKTVLFVLILMLCIPKLLLADDFAPFKNSIKIAAEASGFFWTEHYGGRRLLEETGVIYGTGVIFNGITRKRRYAGSDRYRLTYGGALTLNFGTVDYDGHTQGWDPVETDVDYLGAALEGRLGWLNKTKTPNVFFAPELSLGINSWSRDLKSTSDAIGYKENWTNIYNRAGLKFLFLFNNDLSLSVTGGANMPISVRTRVDLEEYGTVKLSPEAFHLTPFFNIAFDYKRVGVSLYYDAFLFGESDVASSGIMQPKSYTDTVGVRLTFRAR